jgi:hypothetical protein
LTLAFVFIKIGSGRRYREAYVRRATSFAMSCAALLLGGGLAALALGCDRGRGTTTPDGDALTAETSETSETTGITEIPAVEAAVEADDPFASTSIAPEDAPRPSRMPDVVYVPTPHEVVDVMLEVADVGPDDVLYDLGSGDGRIPIAAARRWGTRGVGIEIDPKRLREANIAAHRAGVADKVAFIEADLFETDLTGATVITLYLLPGLNLRLRSKLLRLAPGTRIVTHNYHMGDWIPLRQIIVGDSVVYFWTVPETMPPYLME